MAELSTSQVFGDLTVSGLTKTSVLQSLIGTGTAPLVIASTTLVNNLNADLLDGFHGAVYAATDTYVLRGSSLANIQATGLSNSWGVTSGTATGGLNVVMGTGGAATWLISGTSNGIYKGGLQLVDSGSEIRLYALTGWLDLNSAGVVTASGGFSGSLTGNASTAAALQTARTIAISGDGVGTATSFDGSDNITIPFTLANVATAGTYRSVTVNEKGLVTAGTNPTTLSGYGITDATPSSHVGTNGAAHAIVTTSVDGFMSAVDKVNLDKVPLLGQGLRNSFLCDGGQLNWGITANVFSWSKAYNIYPAQGTLLLNGLPFKKLTIAASSVTLPSAGQCAYITVPTAYSDAPNLVGTCTMAVANATTVSGTDKIILYVRDADSCLQGWDGWIVYGTTVQAGGKRDAYVANLYTAASDFIVGVGSRTFAKKTLAETRAILGTNANTVSTLVLRDANGDFAARNITATSFIGNASSATVFQTARTIAISGDGTGTATSFNGSADITIPFTLANVATAGTYRSVTVDTKGRVTAGTNPTTLAGYGITDAVLSTNRLTWNSASVIGNVVGQLAWKNYGNGHTIFDASAGTSPDGTAVNNTNADVVWDLAFPTLMGWNGASTYGVRVDSARNADYLSGLLLNTSGRADVANQIVRTDGNGHIQAGLINTISGDHGAGTISKVYVSGASESYIRYVSPAQLISTLGLVTTTGGTINGNLSVTGNGTFGGSLAVTGAIIAKTLAISNASGANGYGLSLYAGVDSTTNGMYKYGIAFAGTSTFGTHGFVTGTDATYFSSYGVGSGWIFKNPYYNANAGNGNVASIDINGNFATNKISSCSNVNSSAYIEAAIEVRELNKFGAQTGSWSEAPRISFHWGGRVAAQIAMNTAGVICLRDNPGTGWAALECSSVYASGNITAYSDPRLKNIISKIENPLEKLDQLNGYLYERLDLNNKREIGLLTSDVKKVLPELVCTIKTEVTELIPDGVLETLDYSKITALLVEVCKEQQKRIEELEKKVV